MGLRYESVNSSIKAHADVNHSNISQHDAQSNTTKEYWIIKMANIDNIDDNYCKLTYYTKYRRYWELNQIDARSNWVYFIYYLV